MDLSEITLYKQKIEEIVYDQSDIATASVLSKSLKINVNDARILMEEYVKDIRECKPDDLAVTYVLIGLNENNNVSIGVVNEGDLDERAGQLAKVISKYIYSIQKQKNVDTNTIAVLETFSHLNLCENPLKGSIVTPNAIKRKIKMQVILPQSKTGETSKPTIKSAFDKPKKTNNLGNFLTKASDKKEIKKPAAEQKPKPRNIMASFIGKAPPKQSNEANKSKEENAESINSNKSEEAPKIKTTVDSNSKKSLETKEDNKKHKLIDSDSDDDLPPAKKAKEAIPKKKQTSQKKLNTSQASKKRKRIIQEDSDSDDIFGDDDDGKQNENVVEESDHEQENKMSINLPSKTKIRKKVSNISMEEDDGYFRTVNKYEYETIIEKQEEKKQKPTAKDQNVQSDQQKTSKQPSPQIKPSGKGKAKNLKSSTNQMSITNFFKKA